ncbi:MAG TPA: tRNA 2-thiocytidine(32) synthetase TtcA [Vicinamibacterales bacterium]|nr:tRNA 2-thiocytidine(32) synthetase TtcA [Vicinamibacterales bacterium]HPW21439.1 tRNA 2-thiocytidine(32) synthetase TtcA [Vicinamibacterales bacterium]
MPYESTLEARIARKVTRAIVEYDLIANGDRVMVALSGGKDSWALLQILDVLRRRAPVTFDLFAVTVDTGFEGLRTDLLSETCAARGWEHHVERTSIGAAIGRLLKPGDTPCSLCARFRRGVLYRLAGGLGATKIALGHHLDDVIETALLNLLFAGTLKAMPARLTSDRGGHVVIRPLVLVGEEDTHAYARERGLAALPCRCPARETGGLQRERVRRLIAEFERAHPGVRASMLRALANVAPSHLLDRRLIAGERPTGGRASSGDADQERA